MHDPAPKHGHDGHTHAHPHGHNGPHGHTTQWQTPHLPHAHDRHDHDHQHEPDLDLVEAAFVEGFGRASDPTSFLRLARIPFRAERDGKTLDLLRVRMDTSTDVASVTPYQGGKGHRVAPLPASLVAHRRDLRLVYLEADRQGEDRVVELTLAEARALADLTPAR